MKILSITAGAAGMYCGSCFRDNALAIELLAQGHDISLVPVYTPTRTEDANVSQRQVLFGGISVYLQHRFAMFRHETAHARSVCGTRRRSSRPSPAARCRPIPGSSASLTVSMLRGRVRRPSSRVRQADGVDRAASRCRTSSICRTRCSSRWPLRCGRRSGGRCAARSRVKSCFSSRSSRPIGTRRSQLIRRQVGDVDQFIAVSDYCARFMSDFLKIPADRDVGRAARHQPDRIRARASAANGSRSATSRAWRRRKDCMSWPMRSCVSCQRRRRRPRAAGGRGVSLGRSIARISTACVPTREGRAGGSVRLPRRGPS